MEIDAEKLRMVFERLLDNAVRNVGPTLPVDVDEFWAVQINEAYDVWSSPELTVGSVSESWRSVQKLAQGEEAVGYGFVWLADVLRAVAHDHVA